MEPGKMIKFRGEWYKKTDLKKRAGEKKQESSKIQNKQCLDKKKTSEKLKFFRFPIDFGMSVLMNYNHKKKIKTFWNCYPFKIRLNLLFENIVIPHFFKLKTIKEVTK